ncbi:lysophospholipid acyltransferase family protein [Alkalimarinus sediminis]|uniref:1-acyl-sn-glycerol-3-phosphate acyltransferase n=1 Tax=Alkalimarinus sediminis TaxID=1632866 RepID=A0A9E8HKY2_9ALTE|nr:1-acylglycerol-3-phosphate O-acyltransferase [Alkalimarinus sediminis]UZW74598.1 1-acylglycerol-3-phosphate O-acyltransferase [Alkalimarinus sediminis]
MLSIIRVPLALFFFVAVAVIGCFLLLFRPFNPDNTRVFGRIYSWGGTRILGIKLNIKGLDSVSQMPPSVVIANHQDNLDLYICGGAVPKRTVSVGKKSLLYIPGFGLLYWLAGNVLIDRSSSKSSKAMLNATTEALTKGNRSIWVFPEGTRNYGKNLLPFKAGAFRMAIEAGVPIVPICVSSYSGRLKLNKRVSGRVNVEILEPISTKGMTVDDIDKLKKLCWDKMKQTIDRLDQQLLVVD